MVKATDKEKEDPKRSKNWVTSRRGFLKIYNTYMKVGDWKFEFDKIDTIIVHKLKGFPLSAIVLDFEYNEKKYQIGLNPWTNPVPYLHNKAIIKEGKLKSSKFAFIIRLVSFSYLGYLLAHYIF